MEKIVLRHRVRKTKDLYAITCEKCDHVYIAKSQLKKCPKCKITHKSKCYSFDKKESRGSGNGYGGHPLNVVWHGMIYRCYKKEHQQYKNYGARGIAICDEWKNSFDTFFNWCINNGWEYGKYIDRKENDGNYEPSNCRFVSKAISSRNQRKFKNNKSGYTGINYHKKNEAWYSTIYADGVNICIGMFKDKINAVKARNEFIIQYNLSGFKIQSYENM